MGVLAVLYSVHYSSIGRRPWRPAACKVRQAGRRLMHTLRKEARGPEGKGEGRVGVSLLPPIRRYTMQRAHPLSLPIISAT